MEKLIVSM